MVKGLAGRMRGLRAQQSEADKAKEQGELRHWPVSSASKIILKLANELFGKAKAEFQESLAAAAQESGVPAGISANIVDEEWVEIKGRPPGAN